MGRGRAWRSLWSSYPTSPIVKKFGLCMCAVETVSSPLLRGGRSGFFFGLFLIFLWRCARPKGVSMAWCVCGIVQRRVRCSRRV